MANFANVQAFTNVLTTELNSLANATFSAASSAQDNSTNLYGFADVSVALASINPTSAGARVEIHISPRIGDGTTYADLNASTMVGSTLIDTGSSTKEALVLRIPIPPGHFKWAIRTQDCVTLGASGNIVSARYYDGKGA